MKRKTAMMEAIEKIDHALAWNVEGGIVEPYSWTELSIDLGKLLEKEKEQIMDAFDYNQDSGYSPDQSKELAEEYYNETFKQD